MLAYFDIHPSEYVLLVARGYVGSVSVNPACMRTVRDVEADEAA
jgi:hypothetical protein